MSLVLAAFVYPGRLGAGAASASHDPVIARTPWGPRAETDRDFVVKGRAAGLWEYPVGQIGLQKGTSKAVGTASQHLVDGHFALDTTCRRTAPMLNITLPGVASPQQQGFVFTLTADNGEQVDTDLANILRMTHGSIVNTVAKIRSTPRTRSCVLRRTGPTTPCLITSRSWRGRAWPTSRRSS